MSSASPGPWFDLLQLQLPLGFFPEVCYGFQVIEIIIIMLVFFIRGEDKELLHACGKCTTGIFKFLKLMHLSLYFFTLELFIGK